MRGMYGNYHDKIYSNLAMTKEALNCYHDPMQAAHLYAPLGEMLRLK
jgi:hypothetical protein